MDKNVVLSNDEQIVFQIEAPMWNDINNPLMRGIGKVVRLIAKIFGNSKKGFLTVTNKRVIVTYETYTCWCIQTNKLVKTILPQSIKEIGYTMEKTFLCFCPRYVLYYEGFTDILYIALSNSTEEQIAEYVTKFYNAISR